MGTGLIERTRRVWTPRREVEELVADLSPQTELDSEIRSFFGRIVKMVHDQGKGPITLDVTEPIDGSTSWSVDLVNGRTIATIWYVPEE